MQSSGRKGYHRKYTIRSYEVDAGGRLSVPSVFNLLQDAASSHALELGVSVPQLLAANHTWVLSRIILKMSSYPAWRDVVEVRTWPSGIQGAFAMRDFEMRDNSGRRMGCARSAWIVIETAKRRPVRPGIFADRLKDAEDAPVMDYALNKLPRPDGTSAVKRFKVRYGDLDINQHVNNVSYVEWLLESIPGFGESLRRLSGLEINFVGEAFLGDQVSALCLPAAEDPNTFAHHIRRESDQTELIRARTLWQ